MIRLALLRHGPTSWNRAGRIQGRTDIALEDAARADLTRLALPDPWTGAQLWSSPLRRAVETAELVSGNAPRIAPELLEMHWGQWEGQKGADLLAQPRSGYRHIEDWGWDYRPPDGESPADLRQRLDPWLDRLDRDSVAVCHIGVMRVLLAMATGWAFNGPAPFRIKRNRLFVLTYQNRVLQSQGEPLRLIPRAAA